MTEFAVTTQESDIKLRFRDVNAEMKNIHIKTPGLKDKEDL